MTERRKALQGKPPVKTRRSARVLRALGRFVSLAALLVAGTYGTLEYGHVVPAGPAALSLPVSVVHASDPTEEAFRIGQLLSQHTKDPGIAFRVADAIVNEGYKQHIDPELLVGVVLTEDPDLNPHAKSRVGARGLMQVMPFHRGKWGCGSSDLYDIESNICHGVKILKQAIADAPNMRVALLRYNGCVRGRNTPDCHSYDDKVLRHADKTTEALRELRRNPVE